MSAPRIYLDHAATTPLRPEARAAMEEGFALWANPSSPHREGRKAREALENARARVRTALGWEGELLFTSGASEALALAMQRAKPNRRLISAVEHDAVHRAAPDAQVVPVGADWILDRDALAGMLEGEAAVVALQHVNSETGTVQPVDSIAAQVRKAGGLLVCDASQSAGKLVLPDADMIVVSAHKLGGPIGIGALLLRDYAMLEPTGGQERGYRAGTENLPAAMGFAAAVEAQGWTTDEAQRSAFRENLAGEVLGKGETASHIVAVAHPRLAAQALLIRLDAMGFAVSAGSACSSGTLKRSRVLEGFGVPESLAARTIRVSIGWNTTSAELDSFADVWARLCAE